MDREGYVCVIRLNRPEARNAVSPELAVELAAAFDNVESDASVRVAVLSAVVRPDRPVFSAGADLAAVNAGRIRELSIGDHGFAGLTTRERSKPLIAAVDGLATAGGCEMVLACDVVVASYRSAFGLAEVRRGLVAGAGGLYRLPSAIGEREAIRAILTGEPLTAQRAFELGLVSELTPEGAAEQAAVELATTIAASAPLAVRRSLDVIRRARWMNEAELVAETNGAMRDVLRSNDVREGVQAFLDKRQPEWTGT